MLNIESHFKLSVPAKNFMLGEYAILDHGTALLFTHEPRFMLTVSLGMPQLVGIPLLSPAGRFYQQHFSLFSSYFITFIDPYHGMGGLGASSAQFILIYALYQHLQSTPFSLETLLKTYQHLTESYPGFSPSGADVIAQSVGGLLYWAPQHKEITHLNWPFADTLSLHFIHTKHKIKTHEYLQTLQLNFSLDELKAHVENAFDAFKQQDSIRFCNTINSYADLLEEHHLTTENTRQLLQSLKKLKGLKAAKGCGAMGSDVLLIIMDKALEMNLNEWIKENNLYYLCNQQNISVGLLAETSKLQ